ncbi:hypothetical protein OSTOST_09862, partial [Ostertagia ostertagi]
MGLKKWMAVVKSDQNGTNFSSRKQDRKKAKRLRKLQSVACARHQPIEKIMEEAFKSKKMSKKRKRKLRKMEAEMLESEKQQHEEEEPLSKRRRKRDDDSSESDSDAELTYEQYLKEVQEKKHKIAVEGDDDRQDDIDIHRYSKLLGIKEGKKAKKPKSFTNDGLDYLLDFCDSDSRKRILASSTDQEIILKGDDLGEEEEVGSEDGDDDIENDDGADLSEQGPSEEEEPDDDVGNEVDEDSDDEENNE